MIVKKQDQRFRRGAAAHVVMLAVSACAVSLGGAAHGQQPGEESNDVPSLDPLDGRS